jgi:hypothetical protein
VNVTKVLMKCELGLSLFRFLIKKELGKGGKNKVFIEKYVFATQQMTVLTGST